MPVRLLFILFVLTILSSASAQDFSLHHVRTFIGHEHGVKKAVFAPDGKTFASGGTRGEVMIWNVDNGQIIRKMDGHYSSINDLRYTKDGRFIVTAANDGHVKVWNAASGHLVFKCNTSDLGSERAELHFALLSDDADKIFFGGTDRTLRMCKVNGDQLSKTIYTDTKDAIRCAALSPNGKEILMAAGESLVVLDLTTNKVVREYNTGTCSITSLQYSADGNTLLTWCTNSRVDMRDAQTFQLKTSFRSGSGDRKFSNMAFSDDQKYVITGDQASRFHMWDLAAKKLVLDEASDQGTIQDFDVDTRQNYLLSASLDKTIKLWSIGEKVIEDPTKKSKETPPVAPQVLILTQDETTDDLVVTLSNDPQTASPVNAQNNAHAGTASSQTLQAPGIISEVPELVNGRRIKPIRSDHKLNLQSRRLTIKVWDAQVVDGDIISLFINNEPIISEYTIVTVPKTVTFDASAYKRAYVYLHAHNVGSIPPNTATLMISDGIQDIQVEMRSDLTGSAAMELNFIDP